MKLLSGYSGHVADYVENGDKIKVIFCSSVKNTQLTLYSNADVKKFGLLNKKIFLMQPNCPIVVKAYDPLIDEQFVIFDQSKHGYDAIFSDVSYLGKDDNKPIKKIVDAEKIIAEIHYAIDFESEKEDFEFDENGKLLTESHGAIDWDFAKTNGADWISLFYVDKKGRKHNIMDLELA